MVLAELIILTTRIKDVGIVWEVGRSLSLCHVVSVGEKERSLTRQTEILGPVILAVVRVSNRSKFVGSVLNAF